MELHRGIGDGLCGGPGACLRGFVLLRVSPGFSAARERREFLTGVDEVIIKYYNEKRSSKGSNNMKKISLFFITICVFLLSSQADARRLKQGMRGDDVRQWQTFLRQKGYKVGAADGIYGRNTVKATMAFQKKYKIKADGIVGPQTTRKAMSQGYQHYHDHEDAALDCC